MTDQSTDQSTDRSPSADQSSNSIAPYILLIIGLILIYRTIRRPRRSSYAATRGGSLNGKNNSVDMSDSLLIFIGVIFCIAGAAIVGWTSYVMISGNKWLRSTAGFSKDSLLIIHIATFAIAAGIAFFVDYAYIYDVMNNEKERESQTGIIVGMHLLILAATILSVAGLTAIGTSVYHLISGPKLAED